MAKTAFVFPGQGAQSIGMANDVFEQHETVKSLLLSANDALGYDLLNIMFQGPEETLKQTIHTQPALLAASIAYLQLVKEAGYQADYVAGHSLGEYSALVAAGVLTFQDAIKTVRKRGEYMEAAVPSGQGAMAAVLGAERAVLKEACEQISKQYAKVELANVNCPGQIVVSGTVEGVQQIVAQAKQIGAKRVIPLEVSGPFHSSLMLAASKQLATALQEVDMQNASIPLIANVTAEPVVEAQQIRQLLVEQVCAPVLWEDSVNKLIELGVDTFIEIGSGAVLSGLIKKINRDVQVITVNSLTAAQGLKVSL